MPILNCIPESVVIDILSGWCNLSEIVKFDSAVCDNKQRAHLQHLYSRKFFSVSTKLKGSKLSNLDWCCLKGLSVFKIEVTGHDDQLESISKAYPSYSTNIKYIASDSTYAPIDIHQLVNFINACSEMSGISLKGCIYGADLMNFSVDTLARLTAFDFISSNHRHHSFIAYMAQHCRQLTSLTSYGFGAENESVFIELIEKNEKLRDISIQARGFDFSGAILDTLTTRLDCLSSVYLSDCSKIPYRSVVKFIVVASKTLKSIEMTSIGFNANKQGLNYFLEHDYDLGRVISSLYISLDKANNDIKSTADLMYIFEHLTTLDHISMNYMKDTLTDDVLHWIASTNGNLSRFHIGFGCDKKYNVGMLKDIFKECTQAIDFSKF